MSEHDVLRRRAYNAYREQFGDFAAEPCHDEERFSVLSVNGRRYVYLGNNASLLACYSVRKNGRLNWLTSVPQEIRSIWAA